MFAPRMTARKIPGVAPGIFFFVWLALFFQFESNKLSCKFFSFLKFFTT